MSENNPYHFLENLIDSGNQMINLVDGNDELVANLVIRLEAVIDIARIIVPPGSGFEFAEEKKQMEANLNEFRKRIAEINDKCDKAVVKEKIKQAHRMIESSWGL